jgi:protocatechuate 3,4-dioxygenase, alpha subunit
LLRAEACQTVLVAPDTQGVRIRVAGHVYDADGIGVPDAMVEVWQANHHGRYNHPADRRPLPLDPRFSGYGRCGTDAAGGYGFTTIKPGRVPFGDGRQQAPHIGVALFARGLLNHLVTRLYFADEPANAEDPVLLRVPVERRTTLIAQRVGDEAGETAGYPAGDPAGEAAGGAASYRFDIVLRGANETVFLNLG